MRSRRADVASFASSGAGIFAQGMVTETAGGPISWRSASCPCFLPYSRGRIYSSISEHPSIGRFRGRLRRGAAVDKPGRADPVNQVSVPAALDPVGESMDQGLVIFGGHGIYLPHGQRPRGQHDATRRHFPRTSLSSLFVGRIQAGEL